LLRSPWNTNPTPYLLRSNDVIGVTYSDLTLPTCTEFTVLVESGKLSLAGLMNELNGGVHGQVHIMLGGHWGFDENDAAVVTMLDLLYDGVWRNLALLAAKFLWRQGYVRCPESCSADTPAADCVCSCPAGILRGRSPYDVLSATGMVMSVSNLTDADYAAQLDMLCHVGHPGETITSHALIYDRAC
jgi:hypothetical protein